MIRRSSVSLKTTPALVARRVLLNHEKLVYVLVASKKLHYGSNQSKVAYIGTTKKGGSRVAGSVSARASAILKLHGVTSFEARVVTCSSRQHVQMWVQLERAFLLAFKEVFGEVPRCNIHGKGYVESNEFRYFSKSRIKAIIHSFG